MAELCDYYKKNQKLEPVVVLPYEGDGKPILEKMGIHTIVVKSCTWAIPMEWSKIQKYKYFLKASLYNLPAISEISNFIQGENIDLVHLNTSWAYAGALAAKKAGVPYIWHIREALQQQQREFTCRHFAIRLMKQADAVCAISGFVGKQYEESLGSIMTVIHDSVDEKRFIRQREILRESQLTILSVGMFLEQKGQLQLLEACKILHEEGFDSFQIHLVGRGQGAYADSLKQYVVENVLEQYVTFHEATREVEHFYWAADVFAMTSRDEGFGRTTAEAMLSGCLVIGADSGATPELIENKECGLLYPHGDARALADKIKWVASHREAAIRIAQAGQKRAFTRFTITQNAERIFEQYRKLLQNT